MNKYKYLLTILVLLCILISCNSDSDESESITEPEVMAKWQQLGNDIYGETTDDLTGHSVSLSADGLVVATGTPYNSGGATNAGYVRVFKNNNGTWQQIGSDIDGEGDVDGSGHSISLSSDGSVIAIGAIHNHGNGTSSGHVRVFQSNNGTWQQLGNDIDGESTRDSSGWSVSLSSDGSIVAIGAPFNDGNGDDAGHVRVYQYNNGTWQQIGSDIDGESANDYSGWSVSLNSDGSILAIGAHSNDGNGSGSGHVRVYKNNLGTWHQIGSDIDGENGGDNSGHSISLNSDGSIVAIGAVYNDGNNFGNGHVRVFKNNSGTWQQIGSDIDGEDRHDSSGWSVSLSSDGSVVAIGATWNDENGTNSGHVRIFENDSGTWQQIGSDIDGAAIGNHFGYAVSLNEDGETIAIGAPYNDNYGSDSGIVKVFRYY